MISAETREKIRKWRPLIQQHLDKWCKKHKASFTMKVARHMVRQDWYGDDEQLEEWICIVVTLGEGQDKTFEFSMALAEVYVSLLRKKLIDDNVSVTSMLPMD